MNKPKRPVNNRRKIQAWNKFLTPGALIRVLLELKAPKAVFAEISIALAEAVLPVFEKSYPRNHLPKKAIEAAKTWFNDRTTANAWAASRAASDAYSNACACTEAESTVIAPIAAAYAASSAADTVAFSIGAAVIHAEDVALYAERAGISRKRVMAIVRKIGEKHFTFLAKR